MKSALRNITVCLALVLSAPAAFGAFRSPIADANNDGRSDVDTILGIIAYLQREGVVYDDHAGDGHIPTRHADGKFHMVCVDLLTVCYRSAGYEFGGAKDLGGRGIGSAYYRQSAHLQQRVMADPRFRYYAGPGVNPVATAWKPDHPFRVGDMVFSTYSDTGEHHTGIVTSVDTRNGLPSTVTQISSYTPTGSIHRSTWREFFWLKCRTLTGWARPALWETLPPGDTEKALTGRPPASVDANPVWLTSGTAATLPTSGRLMDALQKVRDSRRGVYTTAAPPAPVAEALPLTARNRHATHFFQ